MKIRKAIIPAAGLGTRFLPATKSIPKEMLPIIDKPTIQFIIEECVRAGIEEIIIVVSSSKNSIIDHFDYNYELEERLKIKNKIKEKNEIKSIADMVNLYYIRQKEPLGLGNAIHICKLFINNEPFAVLLGDDVIINNKSKKYGIAECIDLFEKTKSNVLGVQIVEDKEISKYGITDVHNIVDNQYFEIKNVIEKPKIGENPSNYAIFGRYVFNPEIFHEIEKVKKDINGEIQLTTAIQTLIKKQKLYGKILSSHKYDLGSKTGFVKAVIDSAINRDDISDEILEYINKIKENIK